MSAVQSATSESGHDRVMYEGGVGSPVRRVEDVRLLTGQGRYVDDLKVPYPTVGFVARSPHAHAKIVKLDRSAEQIVYETESGQLLTGSFMDYAMPRASDLPMIVSEFRPVPAKTNPLGVKGGSESGNAGAPAAVVHAILDALSAWQIADIPVPATPMRIWACMRGISHAG